MRTTTLADLPPELLEPLAALHRTRDAFITALSFIILDTGRDPIFATTHLLAYISHDFLQSAVAIPALAMEGTLNVCKRELRYILEAAIKLCYVQQKDYRLPIPEKLTAFEAKLRSPSIGLRQDIQLSMLSPEIVEKFNEDVGRAYGRTSNYVHLTPSQIRERILAVDAGRTSGFEGAGEVEELNRLTAEVLALVLVYLFHAAPSYVAGDFFVGPSGETVDWFFMESKYLAMLDASFDYKHERKSILAEVVKKRSARVTF